MTQIFIPLLGVIAIYLSQQKDENMKRYACIFGVLAQPFWFYSSYQAEQWGIFLVCFAYTYSWGLGVKHYWIDR